MLAVTATDDWRTAHAGAIIGLLEVTGVVNSAAAPVLDERKRG